MKVGSLFSGIGGFDLGLERAGFEISWQVEIDDYCRRVLQKHWPAVPCHYDITTIDWHWIPRVDLVCGGFPCQPFSCAGKQRGKDDDRYLWPEVVRCLAVLRPTWFLGENVPGLLHLGIEQVLADLEALGYQTAVLGIPACGVDAPHIRQRIWIVANSQNSLRRTQQREVGSGESVGDKKAQGRSLQKRVRGSKRGVGSTESGEDLADAARELPHGRGSRGARGPEFRNGRDDAPPDSESARRLTEPRGQHCLWLPEPELGRVAHGIPNRVDRLKGLGNAVVPAIAEALGRMILEADNLRGVREG